MWFQGEMDQIRTELAALRQAVGKNRSLNHDDSARTTANVGNGASETMPGMNTVDHV